MGMKASLSLKRHVTVLDETVVFLRSLVSEIEFTKSGINIILARFSAESTMKSLVFLKNFTDAECYSDFHGLWRKSIGGFPYYKSREKEKMLQLGSFLGTTDVTGQTEMINLYISYFSEYRSKAKEEYESRGKMYSLLGLFTGAAVYILLI